MIIDGKRIAEDIMRELEGERDALPPVVRLGVLMGAGDTAAASFVRIKERVADRLRVVVVREFLEEDATTAAALRALERLVKSSAGVIVQLPLPKHVDLDAVLEALPPNKDVDGLTKEAPMHPPVAEAVREILSRAGVEARGKKAAVLGAGRLVGTPAAALLRGLGAEVSVIARGDSPAALADADIIVLGAGSPGLVKPEMLKRGVVLIDAGTSEASGKLAGDADPACSETASVFTPVPGGVGPIAVAMIFKNLFGLTKLAKVE